MKPILFSTEMVKAIREGRKTQTRRMIKPQPISPYFAWGSEYPCWCDNDDGKELICPYGQPGDILWVRETWAYESPTYCFETSVSIPVQLGYYVYRADYQESDLDLVKWRPSIHMPHEAARLFLLVKDVRVERLQDITEADAIAEGIQWTEEGPLHAHYYTDEAILNFHTAREAFAYLWDELYAERGYGWDTNPFCWVVSFEVIRKSWNSR